MKLTSAIKGLIGRLLFKLLPRYLFDTRYRSEVAGAIAPILRSYAEQDDYFDFWQEQGFHLTPNRFDWPVPDTRYLDNHLWNSTIECPGIDFRDSAQMSLLKEVFPLYVEECNFELQPTADPFEFHLGKGAFEAVDAEVLYSLVRYFEPRYVVEIGGGSSTLISAKACRCNAKQGTDTRLIVIEPYPNKVLSEGIPGVSELIEDKLENVPLDLFERMGGGDVLFVDSTHVVNVGGDVTHLFFNVLPCLAPGVMIHFHDIFLPEEYPRDWVLRHHRFWTEQYLLRAFLMHNRNYEIVWAGNYMRLCHSQGLASIFSSYRAGKTLPGSFWIRKLR